MANNGEIVIHIKKGDSTQENLSAQQNQGATTESKVAKNLVAVALVNEAKKIGMQALNMYGDLTGDSVTQNKIDGALKMVSDATTIAIGGVVGAIAVGVDVGLKAVTNSIQID